MAVALNPGAKYAYLRIHTSEASAVSTGSTASTQKSSLDELSFRKSIQDALTQMFGTTVAGTYLDILSFRSIASGESSASSRVTPLASGQDNIHRDALNTPEIILSDAVIRVASS